MVGLFLQSNASALISAARADDRVKAHALEVLEKGYTLVKGSIPQERCDRIIEGFHRFERVNERIFLENLDAGGHYPRIVNLHCAWPELLELFTKNSLWLEVQDLLFGAPTALYTSLFYHVGSQQSLHRDTPVFSTRPEYLYFGTSVYLEASDEDNGCLEVLEGGHLMPELDREAIALRHYGSLHDIPDIDNDIWTDYQNSVVSGAISMGLPVKKIRAGAGDSLIWHPQLPHGGSAIANPRRTRFSLVMHTTPEGVPVYHQNVFFHPSRPFPETAAWTYREIDGRKIADFRSGVNFGHQHDYALDEFRQA